MTDLDTRLDELLAQSDADLLARRRRPWAVQPVHTLYLAADRVHADTVREAGAEAEELLDACAVALDADSDVVERVRRRLRSRPVDDLRIDFEDGYGHRPDDVEDADVRRVAALSHDCPSVGIRFKSLEPATRRRAVRTVEMWLDGGGRGILTLPKVTSVAQVAAMTLVCDTLERRFGTDPLSFEVQIETPQSILGPDGTALVARMIAAGEGRVSGLHYGTYDYSASLGISAQDQSLEHPVADHAKAVMQVAAAGTGVFLSDGSSNILPLGSHRDDAWRLHARLVTRSLRRGYYQGWDLHPAQLPSRHLATVAFYRDGLATAQERLLAYTGGGTSHYLDEPATAAALSEFVLRAIESGAVDESELTVEREQLMQLVKRAS